MNIPSKILLSACSSLLFVCPTFSQTAQKYAFDNFDASSGVHIQVAEKPAPKPTKRGRRSFPRMISSDDPFVKKTDLAIQPIPTSVKTASIKNLDGFTTGDVKIDGLIAESGARNNVDPALIYSFPCACRVQCRRRCSVALRPASSPISRNPGIRQANLQQVFVNARSEHCFKSTKIVKRSACYA